MPSAAVFLSLEQDVKEGRELTSGMFSTTKCRSWMELGLEKPKGPYLCSTKPSLDGFHRLRHEAVAFSAKLRCTVAAGRHQARQAHHRESERPPPDDHLRRISPRHSTAYTSRTSLTSSGKYCESSTLDECRTCSERQHQSA